VSDDVLPWGEVIYRSSLMLIAIVMVATAVNFIYDHEHRPAAAPARALWAGTSDLSDRVGMPKDEYGVDLVYSAGIGVAGAVGALAASECVDGPRSGRSSIAIKNAIPKDKTSAQAKNTNLNA